jgi:hypothetical protein
MGEEGEAVEKQVDIVRKQDKTVRNRETEISG